MRILLLAPTRGLTSPAIIRSAGVFITIIDFHCKNVTTVLSNENVCFMPESLHPQEEHEQPQPVEASGQRWPTEEELREFEAWNELHRLPAPYTIEEFGYDRETGPTEEDFRALEEWNNIYRLPDLYSFEDYFGYPDPRGSSAQEDQGDLGGGDK
jgi:hypothetical protein